MAESKAAEEVELELITSAMTRQMGDDDGAGAADEDSSRRNERKKPYHKPTDDARGGSGGDNGAALPPSKPSRSRPDSPGGGHTWHGLGTNTAAALEQMRRVKTLITHPLRFLLTRGH